MPGNPTIDNLDQAVQNFSNMISDAINTSTSTRISKTSHLRLPINIRELIKTKNRFLEKKKCGSAPLTSTAIEVLLLMRSLQKRGATTSCAGLVLSQIRGVGYPLDLRPDAVALYSVKFLRCGRALGFCQMTPAHCLLVGLVVGERHARMKIFLYAYGSNAVRCARGKGLVLPNPNIDQISTNTRYLLLALPNNEMSNK
ncbi:hypothetical protein TNCV_2327321 [Trichonephila clavipes]|nr:hypothetical protein TNCV_2327321 [Trichonephila clavipes]